MKLELEGTVDFVVEAVDFSGSGERDEFDFFGVSWFEAYGGAGGDVEAEASGGLTVEFEGFVDFVEVEVTADLDGAVACIADGGGYGREADVGLQLLGGGFRDDFSGDHWIGLWMVTSLVPSGKVASAWTSWIISATPSITSSFFRMVAP